MASFLKRVTLVDLSNPGSSTVLFESPKRKRKVSRWLKPFERADFRLARATEVFGQELVRRHERSNEKRRDGWLRDGGVNVMRAGRRAVKKLTGM